MTSRVVLRDTYLNLCPDVCGMEGMWNQLKVGGYLVSHLKFFVGKEMQSDIDRQKGSN